MNHDPRGWDDATRAKVADALRRGAYTTSPVGNRYSTRSAAWRGTQTHLCLDCGQEWRSAHAAAFHECTAAKARQGLQQPPQPGPYARLMEPYLSSLRAATEARSATDAAALRERLAATDYRRAEARVLAHVVNEPGAVSPAAWAALGRCPWDNWKPGRDIA